MATETPPMPTGLSEKECAEANARLLGYLQTTLETNQTEVKKLHKKLETTYWIIVILSVVMFSVGVLLLSVPAVSAYAAYQGSGDATASAETSAETSAAATAGELTSLIAGGLGLADLTALFLFRPIERIHRLMGDMSQMILAINSFQDQVALRLLEIDGTDRTTMGRAAEQIRDAARDSIGLIQEYFEEGEARA